jgi:hypothetical protein
MLNEDYKDVLQIFLKYRVKFLVVGDYAMPSYGYPRATGDFDIWVESSSENSERIYRSLLGFGAHLKDTFPIQRRPDKKQRIYKGDLKTERMQML